MAHSYAKLLTHIVYSTKNRAGLIDTELKPRLSAYLGGIVRELDGIALTIGGVADHVHLLVTLLPTVTVADALRVIKTNSSHWVHQTWPDRRSFGWQTGYGAFSVSQSNIEALRRYIDNQEEHHRRMTFQEEFIALLEKHGISYDERYIWD